jgi:hypothetical protein
MLSDRTKRWLILKPTTMLPRALRVVIRRDLLSRLEIARARRAKLLIIGHPKSGNTWLRVMLSRLYQVRHHLPAQIIAKSDELALHDAAAPRLLATNGYYSYESVVGKALDADLPRTELHQKNVVLLVRHPCDIAVSWYFQFTKRQSPAKRELINHSIPHPIDHTNISMWDFVMHSDIGLSFLIDYLNRWERNVAGLERSILIRYEELRTHPLDTLRRVVDLMGESFSAEEIQDAVSFGSFDNLRQLETAGFFRRGGLSLRNASDPDTFKVRRGKISGYRDYFSPEQLAQMDEMVATRLSPTLGYAPGDRRHETEHANRTAEPGSSPERGVVLAPGSSPPRG